MLRLIDRALGALVLACALMVAGGVHAQPLKVRISWVATPAHLPPLFMERPELMTRAGQSYTVEAVRLPGMAQTVAALAAGELDIALMTFPVLPLAAHGAKLDDLRIIASEYLDGEDGHYSTEFLTLKDSALHKTEDIKGKKIALPMRGGSNEMALRAVARKLGLDEKRDYTIVEAAPQELKAMLLDGRADVVAIGHPGMSADPTVHDAARALFTQRDALGPTAQVVWVARASFLERNRAALVDFMADALRMRRFLTDPKNHAQAVDIVARATKWPREKIDSWLFTKADFYRTPDGLPELSMLQQNIKQVVDLGLAKSGLDVRKYQDFSLAKDAGERLKQ